MRIARIVTDVRLKLKHRAAEAGGVPFAAVVMDAGRLKLKTPRG
jgi:hypothetical protein